MTSPATEAFFFRSADRPLFGIYHPPQRDARRTGVLLSPPASHEYMASHRLYRQLALRLAEAGFAVLRFDLFGCGDSSGEGADSGVAQWRLDVADAARTLRARSGTGALCLAGCRLGGTLAALAAGDWAEETAGIVLWDPVLRGSDWIDELRSGHESMLLEAHVAPRGTGSEEALGFPLSGEQERELRALDLFALASPPAPRAMVVSSAANGGARDLAGHLETLGCRSDFASYRDPGTWTWVEDVTRVLVPAEIVGDVVAWISEVCP